MERRAKVPVLVHEAERLLVVGIEMKRAGLQPVGNRDSADRAARLSRCSAIPMALSMRIELDDTALVRPSKAASVRGAGSAGSTTMLERPPEFERRREREADESAAEDDYVRPIHGEKPLTRSSQ